MAKDRKISRRKFLKRLAIGAAVVGVGGGYSVLVEPHWVQVTRIKIPIAGLPPALEGFKILQMSDLHLSRFVSADYLAKCVEVANQQNPNLIALTGDYVTGPPGYAKLSLETLGMMPSQIERYLEQCIGILEPLRAPSGIFVTLGNHECWFDAEKSAALIQKTPWRLLRDQNTTVTVGNARLQVVGLRDMWGETIDLNKAFKGVDPALPTVVLMHNPDLFAEVAARNADLIMAGHTHGGQVALPFFGPFVVPSKFGRKYASGLFRMGRTRMYVNRGLGVILPPMRIGCRPEISVFMLTRDNRV